MYNKIWIPIKDKMPSSHLAKYMQHIHSKYNLNFTKYEELHHWSITDLAAFWETIVDYFDISFDTPYKQAITPAIPFYNTKWFEGASL
ncbi:MAG: hypothetical protein KJN96_01930, partial [Eudoraea sp.]|nr:hypothetical protein [Eudoraea sp.]